jgi:hypothetical protein
MRPQRSLLLPLTRLRPPSLEFQQIEADIVVIVKFQNFITEMLKYLVY